MTADNSITCCLLLADPSGSSFSRQQQKQLVVVMMIGDLVSGNSLGFDALDDADSLDDEPHAIWRPLHSANLHHVVLVERLEAR